jgi:hypothetical protein
MMMSAVELSEVVRNWAIVAGGGIGLAVAVWRGAAHDRQSRAQRRQAEIAQRAHVVEVFSGATGQLAHEKLEVRLGAVLTLTRISRDFPVFDAQVVELLSAYARERAGTFDEGEEPTVDIVEIVKFLTGQP